MRRHNPHGYRLGPQAFQAGFDAAGRDPETYKRLWPGPFADPMDQMVGFIHQHADIPYGWDLTEEVLGIGLMKIDPQAQVMAHMLRQQRHGGLFHGGGLMAEDLAAGMVEDRNDDKDSGPVFGY
jgi:hypothetical protein